MQVLVLTIPLKCKSVKMVAGGRANAFNIGIQINCSCFLQSIVSSIYLCASLSFSPGANQWILQNRVEQNKSNLAEIPHFAGSSFRDGIKKRNSRNLHERQQRY
ncbi:hypothetical protein RJ641_032715 [Dillenia turbinata]|uniref:Uncharacterized protein n=1 Tax=Dillenia turbinata TaxID=194707 RepID=A0AAN8ZIP3_9MAGN